MTNVKATIVAEQEGGYIVRTDIGLVPIIGQALGTHPPIEGDKVEVWLPDTYRAHQTMNAALRAFADGILALRGAGAYPAVTTTEATQYPKG